MTPRTRGLAIAWLVLSLAGLRAAETVTVSLTVPPVLAMEVDAVAVSFPQVDASDFDAGYVEVPAAITITLSSNTAWQLSVRTDAANLGVVNGYAKPLTDFEWRRQGGTYVPITTLGAIVANDAQGTVNQTIVLDVRMRLHWARDLPGTYGLYLALALAEPAP